MHETKHGEFLYDFKTKSGKVLYSAHKFSSSRVIVYWYEDDMRLKSTTYLTGVAESRLARGEWIKINEKPNQEFVQKVTKTIELEKKTYLIDVKDKDEAFIVDVLWSVNLPNNPSYDDIIAEWVLENFGETKYEYYCLADLSRREIGYY